MRDRNESANSPCTPRLPLPAERSLPCAEGGNAAPCRHTHGVTSVARQIRRTLRYVGSFFAGGGHGDHLNPALRHGLIRQARNCSDATDAALALVGIAFFLAVAIWAPGLLP